MARIKRFIERLKRLFFLIDQMYYIESRNFQMLSELTFGDGKSVVKYELDDSWQAGNPRIIHALGELDGHLFTESVEAFEKHYWEGSRVFELDFSLTSDGEPVVLHDWGHFAGGMIKKGRIYNTFRKNGQMALKKFENVKILGKYTTVTLERFMEILQRYEDAYFIVSVKSPDLQYDETAKTIYRRLSEECESRDPKLWHRLILHAYSLKYFDQCMREFRFSAAAFRLVYSIHPEVLGMELKRRGLTTTTTTIGLDYPTDEYVKVLWDYGIKIIWCTTRNSEKQEEEMLERGVSMIMCPYGREKDEREKI